MNQENKNNHLSADEIIKFILEHEKEEHETLQIMKSIYKEDDVWMIRQRAIWMQWHTIIEKLHINK